MPLDRSIRKVLVIGSGPIVIGQAAEFDYAGTQACRALKEDNIEIVLINSNPATIMTDSSVADQIYIEPLSIKTIKRIIEKEKPDSILSGFGGQTGLTLSMQLAKDGYLEKNGVKLLGASKETIDKAEDRQIFKDTMEKIGEPCIVSNVETTVEGAVGFAKKIGLPVIIRPAFTLGGSGGGIAHDIEQLKEIAENGISMSPIGQILVERCISGWKEIEFEVIRDAMGNTITVCSMENFDPVGIHTGDSIVIAPAVTLADKEYQMLRSASINIINELGVEGGCNVQLALNPDSFEYAVIEVNPRVSRSSALASKATGYPIAKVAAKIAIGYNLDEIINAVTAKTYAAFEPTLDYVAVKFPKWPFDKFVYAKRELGTQMKATGEVMSIADSFEMALMKAVRGAEISLDTLNLPKLSEYTDEVLWEMTIKATDERLFSLYELLKRGVTIEEINKKTLIDKWFLSKIVNILNFEKDIVKQELTDDLYEYGKRLGFTDEAIERISGKKIKNKLSPNYKMVDTCGAEFSAYTPYFYSTFDTLRMGGENEVLPFITSKPRIIVFGSGPIRIGQGIEFDYASVHCVKTLQSLNYDVVIINNNPETVSTDFDTANRLYFEPLTNEDVMHIINVEKPIGVFVAFGGQTAIKLTKTLCEHNVTVFGTSPDSIDMAEDRERFDDLLESLNINRPKGVSIFTEKEALKAAKKLEYPVLMRPSYVLGGQNMIIANCDEDIIEYMGVILQTKQENPILIDKYLNGLEIEIDAICDGVDILIPGIMEHIERTGIHSGDSIAVYPAINIDDYMGEKILDASKRICTGMKAKGIVNIQYIVYNRELYVIEVNPRASRTVPYLSKVTGVPMVDLATRVSMDFKLKDLGYGTGIYKKAPYVAVKVPVFSFEKLTDVDTHLGPEMKSTGEVLGVGNNLEEALYKGLVASGSKMRKNGGVYFSVRDTDKKEISPIAKKFAKMGFKMYATKGTASVLKKAGLEVNIILKIHESDDNTLRLLESGKVNYVMSTSAKGRDPQRDSVKIRRKASLLGIPCITAIDTANAVTDSLMSRYTLSNMEIVNINNMRTEKQKINFTKMQGTGNDYIYINCMEKEVASPEFLAVSLSDRHKGIGGDGVILICSSAVADAKMRIFNLDGSEGMMCGNGIRCVTKYLYDNNIVTKNIIMIETLSGIKECVVKETKGDKVSMVCVNMGKAELRPKLIPVNIDMEKIIDHEVEIEKKKYKITTVSMGNPHCVVFVKDVDKLNLAKIGPGFENNEMFPERVNTEFVELVDDKTIKMRVWERGSGETLACGTGACAAVVATVLNGFAKMNEDITVILLGGKLVINYQDDKVLMTGEAAKVFDGVVEI